LLVLVRKNKCRSSKITIKIKDGKIKQQTQRKAIKRNKRKSQNKIKIDKRKRKTIYHR
jgi:hypothetical protein